MDDEERSKLGIDLHKAHVEESNRREVASSENYDKAILGYSTGALALSVTFISSVVKDMAHAQARWCLKTAWIAWIVAIVVTIISFQISIKAGRIQSENASDYYNGDGDALKRPNRPAGWLTWANGIAGGLFVLGAAFMMAFVWVNI
jgi:hypothetical protein